VYCTNSKCPLATCEHINSHGLDPWGSDNPLLYLVGEAPVGTEDRQGVVFIGRAGQLLHDALRKTGVDYKYLRINNVVRCAPWNEKKARIGTPSSKHIEACLPSLLEDIHRTKPKVIVALGGIAMKALTKLHAGITTVRGNVQNLDIKGEMFPCLPTLHPAGLLEGRGDYSSRQFFLQDLALAWSMATGAGPVRTDAYVGRDYGVLRTLDEVQQYVTHCVELCHSDPNRFITADFEAGCLEEWRAENPVLGLGISCGPYQSRYIPMQHYQSPLNGSMPQLCEILRPLAEIPMANQNIGFDYLYWKRRLGIELKQENIRLDPMLAHHTIFARTRPNDLETMAGLYLNEPAWSYKLKDVVESKRRHFKAMMRQSKKNPEQLSYWEQWLALAKLGLGYATVPLDDLSLYCNIDADTTWRLVPVLEKMLQDANLYQTYRSNYHDAIKSFAEMRYDGVAINNGALEALQKELPGEMSQILVDLTQTKFVQKTQDMTKKTFNLGSHKQVATLLYDVMRCPPARLPGKSTRTTEDGQLQQLLGKFKREDKKDKVEILEKIAEWRSLDKYFGTYVKSNVTYQDPNGLVHPNWNLMGTRTGRVACDSPPLHSAPTSHGLRKQYWSRWHDTGGILLGADESQIEVRIFASLAQDPVLVDFYCNRAGADLHRYMASLLYNVPYESVTSEQRRVAKTCVFASLYGGGPGNLAAQTGMKMSEAVAVHKRFISVIDIEGFRNRCLTELGARGGVSTPFGLFLAINMGYTEGARKHAERQALNTPVQSSASSLVQAAIVRGNRYMHQMGLKSKIVIFHHDAIYWDVYPGELFTLIALAQHVMVTEPAQLYPWLLVPLKIGIEFGNSWGEKIEVHSFDQTSLSIRFEAKQDEENCYERYHKEVASQFEGPMGRVLKLENTSVQPREIVARVTAV